MTDDTSELFDRLAKLQAKAIRTTKENLEHEGFRFTEAIPPEFMLLVRSLFVALAQDERDRNKKPGRKRKIPSPETPYEEL